MAERVYIYDSTLRDGAQTTGIDFTAVDKLDIAMELDKFGIDYIEGGWPGANPTDDAFFQDVPKLNQSKLTAFGMTRRPTASAANDPGLAALINSGTPAVCIVGKSWDFHVTKALEIPLEQNIEMIGESIAHIASKGKEPMFDAEHFFDGYKANPEYALTAIKAAYENGARWVVLCDTNGGSLPHEIESIISEVVQHVPGNHLGIHCHNDTENAVANSIAAVRAGVRQVQGTLNGVGERCGNANLISIIPNLVLKLGFDVGISKEQLKHLTHLSRFLDERLNRQPNRFAPYVGASAFAHKGGLHVSAVVKNASSYEHVPPETVGNRRHILVSNQAGKSNILQRLEDIGMNGNHYPNEKIKELIQHVKEHERLGLSYDSAEASFELLARETLDKVKEYFRLKSFRVIDERRWNAKGELITLSEATARVDVNNTEVLMVSEGNGPVNALDKAIRGALIDVYPQLADIKLVDYKVRILTPDAGTGAVTRVLIESADKEGHRWVTVGVSANVIDASFNALRDGLTYKLMRDELNK